MMFCIMFRSILVGNAVKTLLCSDAEGSSVTGPLPTTESAAIESEPMLVSGMSLTRGVGWSLEQLS